MGETPMPRWRAKGVWSLAGGGGAGGAFGVVGGFAVVDEKLGDLGGRMGKGRGGGDLKVGEGLLENFGGGGGGDGAAVVAHALGGGEGFVGVVDDHADDEARVLGGGA